MKGFEFKRETLKFSSIKGQKQEEEKHPIRGIFHKYFYFDLDIAHLEKTYKVDIEVKNSNLCIKAEDQKTADNCFNEIVELGLSDLSCTLDSKKTIYVHKDSGIPLIGTISFGIIDRNTNIIEVKPVTGCNLQCIYCSVDETKRSLNYLVDKDYIIQELDKILGYKGEKDMEVHIGTQGEPFFYDDLLLLIEDIRKNDYVKEISIDTNGTLLTEELVDKLAEAGLTRINLSINSLDEKKAKKIAGVDNYNIKAIKDIAAYIPKKLDLIIAPVWISGTNDEDMEEIVIFTKELQKKYGKEKDSKDKPNRHKIMIGIQNFLEYRFGKNPVKEKSWEKFQEFLGKIEKKHDIKLLFDFKKDFNIKATKPLPKFFRKEEIISARYVCPGRMRSEKIAAHEKEGWNYGITYTDTSINKDNKKKRMKDSNLRLKITRTKHNIFYGSVA